MTRGERHEDRVIVGDLAQLLAQQKFRLAKQRAKLVEHRGGKVLLDRKCGREAAEIEGQSAANEVGAGLLHARPVRMKPRGLRIAERSEQHLPRASAEERTLLAEDFALHKAKVGAAEDEHEFTVLPPAVPALLDDGRQLRTGGGHPLEFVEREDEFARPAPAVLDDAEGRGPVARRIGGEQRFPERAGGGLEEFADLQFAGRLFARVVEARLARHEVNDQFALADAAAAIDRPEGAAVGLPRLFQRGQFASSPNEFSAHAGDGFIAQ